MSTVPNEDNLFLCLQNLTKRFAESAQNLHNIRYGFWNTITKSLLKKDIDSRFSRDLHKDELETSAVSGSDLRFITTQSTMNTLGALQQDYQSRYTKTRRQAVIASGNNHDRLSRNLRDIFEREKLLEKEVPANELKLVTESLSQFTRVRNGNT